ncbi:MAG: hypothetical protein IJB52_14230 [Clostridia bacterium]|nr:hypothetical protein [Clostridia bacterium]
MKRNISVLLLLVLLLSGCGGTETAETAAPAEGTGETQAAETEPLYLDSLPEMDLGGLTINTLIREEAMDEFSAESSGDVMDTAVYNRNLAIEERFSCKLTYTVELGSWTYAKTFQDTIRGTVMAGDATFDMVTGQSNIVQPLNIEGVFVNLLEEEYLDLEKPYWVESYIDGINLKGEVCTLCGDFALSSFSNANVIFFNKSLMDNYSLEYPYEEALAGKWTLDRFLGMSEDVTTDVNGDQVISLEDVRGFCAYNNSIQPLFSSCGFNYTELQADGTRVLLSPSDALVTVADRMNEFCRTDNFLDANKAFSTGNSVGLEPAMCESFMNGSYLFMGMVLEGIEDLREMEVDFGILPYPKLDEQQSRYYTTILRRYTVAAVPITAADSSNSALILEAMAAEGCQDIIPQYYEIALKGKYIRDESSSQVLDLIKDSLYLEFVDMYYSDLGFSDFFSGYVAGSSSGTYISSVESNRKAWETKLTALYETNS